MKLSGTYTQRSVVFDVANISYEVAISHLGNDSSLIKDPEMLGGISMHTLLVRLHKYFKLLTPDQVIFAFEGGNNWRKHYTQSPACLSKKVYKSNRPKDNTMDFYFNMLNAFREVCTQHTSAVCLTVPGFEGDDVIASYCQEFASPEHEVIVISGDRDFVQLLRNPHVKLLNQRDGKLRNQPDDKKYFPDLEYFIFQKCIRGDKGDWVFPAYPRVRETVIKKAYDDPFARVNLMNETWTVTENGVETTFRVGDLFEENKILLDLQHQPKELREYLDEEVLRLTKEHGAYSDFHFLKFLGQFKLKKISEEVHKFQDMFLRNAKFNSGDISYRTKQAPPSEPVDRTKTKTLAELAKNSNSKLFSF